MKRLLLFLVLTTPLLTFAAAGDISSSESAGDLRYIKANFVALTAVSTTAAFDVSPVMPNNHTIELNITGTPATCTANLQGSLDGTNYFDLSGAQTCTSTVMFHVASRPVQKMRLNLSALSGGSSPTVTVYYLGVRFVKQKILIFLLLSAAGWAQTTCVNCSGSGGTSTPGLPDTSVQSNQANVLTGSSNFLWNNSTNTMTVNGTIANTGVAGSPGTITLGSGSSTTPSWIELDSGDAVSDGECGYMKFGVSPNNAFFGYLCASASTDLNGARRFFTTAAIPAADSTDFLMKLSDAQANTGVVGTDTGAADAYVIAPSPAIAGYVVGQRFIFSPTHANATGTPTLKVNGLGVITMVYKGTTVPTGFMTQTNCTVTAIYNGANFEIVSPPCSQLAGTYSVAANFTSAGNTNLQTITGLSWTFPANVALKAKVDCDLLYSIATAAVAVDFGFQDVTVAPTNLNATGDIFTNTTAVTEATLQNSATTTATSIVSATPSAITTIWQAHLHLFIEQPSNASTSAFSIMVKTANASDLPTVYRGSACAVSQ